MQLTEAMKKSCKGLPIVKSDTEIVSEKEFQRREKEKRRIILGPAKKLNQRGTCDEVKNACQDVTAHGCWYWEFDDLEIHDIHYTVTDKEKELCVQCCSKFTGNSTRKIPCDCLTNPQTFSTAYEDLWGDCFEDSHFCHWDSNANLWDSCPQYEKSGACVGHDDCVSCERWDEC